MAKHPHATPAQLRLLADEVRYLHSLWHRGTTNPNPATAVASSSRPSFKKKKTIINKTIIQPPDPPAEEEDPANNRWLLPPSSPPKTAWGDFRPRTEDPWLRKPSSPPQTTVAEDPDPWLLPTPGWGESCPPVVPPKAAAINSKNKRMDVGKPQQAAMQASVDKAHQAARRTCEIFFSKRAVSPSNPDTKSVREDYLEEDEDDGYESEVFDFLLGVFERDAELRGYYEKNWERGEFSCLVCAGVGAKVGRRYMGCVALVQHANAISKTKRPLAHRALANVVCRVLGWDKSRLPSIVLDLAKPLGKTIGGTAEQKDDLNEEETNKKKEEINNRITDNANAGQLNCIVDSTNEDAAIVDNEIILSDNDEFQERNDDDNDGDDGCGEVDWDLL